MRWCVCLFFGLMTGGVEAQTTRYYGALPFWESPIQPFMGAEPLTAAEAAERVHVAVTYDGKGRLIEIQTKMGDQFKDADGALLALYVHAVRTTISHEPGREVHRFFNRRGRRVTGWGAVWEKVYRLDERGRRLQLVFFDKNGKQIENSWGVATYQWAHQMDGSVIETRFNKKGESKPHRPGFEFERIRLTFGPDGHLSLMQNLDDQNELKAAKSGASQYRYYYGTEGLFMRWEVYDAAGKPALGPTGTSGEWYELSENRREIVFFGPDGALIEHYSGAERWDTAFDKRGNKITRTLRDGRKQAKLGRFGYATLRWDWDDSGLWLTGRRYLGVDGALKNNIDGVAREVFSRDNMGRLDEVRYWDAAGKPVVNAYQKAAVERYTYDENGTRIKTEKFDVTGAPMR